MKTSTIKYRPDLSVADNARINQCSESNIRYYIRRNQIDRKNDRAVKTILKLRGLYQEGMKASELSRISGFSLNTIKKYWSFVTTETDVSKFDSNKRQKLTIRQPKDYYATHPSVTKYLLRVEQFNKQILEPACGGGYMAEIIKQAGYEVTATDIVDRGYGVGGIDFLTAEFPKDCFDIITNPPYSLCVEFIEKALRIAKNKVALLLPLNYLASSERYVVYKESPPSRVYVFVKRIKIAKNGDFDKYEDRSTTQNYAWYVWERGYHGNTILKWIHNT